MSEFKASYDGIGQMLRSTEMQADMRRRAEKIKNAATVDAPYDPASVTHYRDAFSVESGVREGASRRAFGRVTNDDAAAFYIEYGAKTIPAHHTLTRALDAAKD